MIKQIALTAMLVSAIAARAEVTNLNCEQTGPNDYRITFQKTEETHTVKILASTDASLKTGLQPVAETGKSDITVHAGKAGERLYFLLQPDHGVPREVSIRLLPLEGAANFRDLGGYETTDHHFVRWGLLYRSGVVSFMTANDMKYLSQLGMQVVCDFRTAKENEATPERWIDGQQVEHVSVPIGSDSKRQGKEATLAPIDYSKLTPEQARQSMMISYGNFVMSSSTQYAAVFQQLEKDHLPLLYHCTAGKDRTGVFSALVLRTLGVPMETILKDYSLTETYLSDPKAAGSVQTMLKSTGSSSILHASPETRKAMMSADPMYLQQTFNEIDKRYGSFDEYRRQQLHVSDADAENLRRRLLQ